MTLDTLPAVSFPQHTAALADLKTWLDALMTEGWTPERVRTDQQPHEPLRVMLQLAYDPKDSDLTDALRNVIL